MRTDAGAKNAQATYVVFGKAEIEDLSAQATSAAVEQFKAPSTEVNYYCSEAQLKQPQLRIYSETAVTGAVAVL